MYYTVSYSTCLILTTLVPACAEAEDNHSAHADACHWCRRSWMLKHSFNEWNMPHIQLEMCTQCALYLLREHARYNIDRMDITDFGDYKREYQMVKSGHTYLSNSAILRMNSPLLNVFTTMVHWNSVTYHFNLAQLRCTLKKVDDVTSQGYLRGDPMHVKNMMHNNAPGFLNDRARIFSKKRVARLHPNEVFDVTNDYVNNIHWY